jgi:hypothetical protein
MRKFSNPDENAGNFGENFVESPPVIADSENHADPT